ncbi:MAG: sugar ABC transporter substrate-binding protein [Solibacillus sp.]
MNKKWLSLLCGIVLSAVFLAACNSSESGSSGTAGDSGSSSNDGDKIVIGAAMPVFDDKFLSYLYEGINQYADSLGNVSVNMVDAKNDSGKQISQVETFVAQGVDAIIINPVDTNSIGAMVASANDANIPVVVVNRMPLEEDMEKIYAYVGSESLEAGAIQMEEVAKLIGNKGNVGIINGTLGQEAVIKRTQGNKDVIAKYPDIKIAREATADWQRSQGITLMENWIQTGEKFDAIVSNNDEMAIGAIMALEQANMLDQVVVAGIDGTLDALEYIKDGKLSVSAFQDAYGQGKGAIEAAIAAVNGEATTEKFINIPFELVTKDNVDEYIKKWQ